MEPISLGHSEDMNGHGDGTDSEGNANINSCGFHNERSNGDDTTDAESVDIVQLGRNSPGNE
jgi:hypothetical protein